MSGPRNDVFKRWTPILLAQGIGVACGIVGVRLTSQWVAPEDYGVFGVFVSLAPLGATVVYAGLVRFVSRHWQTTPDRATLLRTVAFAALRKLPLLLFACAAVSMLAAPAHVARFAAFLCAAAAFLTALQFAQSALQAAREHWADLGITAAAAITRSFLPPLLYVTTGAGLTALLGGFTAYGVIGALVGAWCLRAWWPRRGSAPAMAMAVPPVYAGAQFVVLAVASWILAGVNRWAILWHFGAETGGYFTLATNVAAILPTILCSVLLLFHQPAWFAATYDSAAARRDLLRRVDRIAVLYTVGAFLAAGLLHAILPRLVGLLINERYAAATPFAFAASCSTAALMIGTIYHAALLAMHRERTCAAADLLGAAVIVLGTAGSILAGMDWFTRWLIISPVVPWLVNRTIAHRAANAQV